MWLRSSFSSWPTLSLLAYVAVQRMPNGIKALHFCRSPVLKLDTQALCFYESLMPWADWFLQRTRGQCTGWTTKFHRPIQAAKWFFWSSAATEGQRGWRVRQQSLWFILKSVFSFCFLFCSLFRASVTGSCPQPCHNSPDTSHLIGWCPPGSHPHAWHRWSCWSPSLWHSPRRFESCGGQPRLVLAVKMPRYELHKTKLKANSRLSSADMEYMQVGFQNLFGQNHSWLKQ